MRRFLPWLLVLVLPPGLAAAEPKDKTKRDEVVRKLIPILIEALHDTEPKVREQAAESLEKIGPGAFAPLLKALRDKDNTVRRYAAYALALAAKRNPGPFQEMIQKDAGIRVMLFKALKDPQPYVSDRAIQLLRQLESAVLPDLIALLKGKDKTDRVLAAELIGDLMYRGGAPRDTLLTLAELLQDKNKEVREAAINAINQGLSVQIALPSIGGAATSYSAVGYGVYGIPATSTEVPKPPK